MPAQPPSELSTYGSPMSVVPNAPEEGEENALKPFLLGALPPKFTVNEGEMLADALVIVRIVDMNGEGGLPERYEYTTTTGLPFALARGMIQCIDDQLDSFYKAVIDASEDDDADD